MLIAWQSHDCITDRYSATLDLSLETTERVIRTADTLYRHIESLLRVTVMDIYRFQIAQQRLSGIPGDMI